MNINDLTLGQAKELAAMFQAKSSTGIDLMVGECCIVRTYSAGVWMGTISEKAGAEVIVTNARRLWRWRANEGISLSCVAVHGINQSNSKIAIAVDRVWLEAIELIPVSDVAKESIHGAKNATAQ